MVATMKCPECAVELYQPSADQVFKMKSTLLSFKAYGNLFVPSLSTFEVVKVTDKLARELLLHWQDISKSSVEKVVVSVLKIVKNQSFFLRRSFNAIPFTRRDERGSHHYTCQVHLALLS